MLQREYPTSVSCVNHRRSYLRADTWHVVTSTDPLADSDEELMDEHVRNDYSVYLGLVARMQPLMIVLDQRIAVIARLRGKAPTPPPDLNAPPHIADTREHRWRTVQSWR